MCELLCDSHDGAEAASVRLMECVGFGKVMSEHGAAVLLEVRPGQWWWCWRCLELVDWAMSEHDAFQCLAQGQR